MRTGLCLCLCLCLDAAGVVEALAAPATRLRVVLETRLQGERDAERVETPGGAFVAGQKVSVQGRLARLTLEGRPWEGDVWQFRYTLTPVAGAGTAAGVGARAGPQGAATQTGVFALTLNERKEFWIRGPGADAIAAFHGIRIELEALPRTGLRMR